MNAKSAASSNSNIIVPYKTPSHNVWVIMSMVDTCTWPSRVNGARLDGWKFISMEEENHAVHTEKSRYTQCSANKSMRIHLRIEMKQGIIQKLGAREEVQTWMCPDAHNAERTNEPNKA
mmetsp:Transcript_12405/g.18643  ORF Transcript_12405/g.18643 Transcript_12405/m.18643 type:complete len:119 (+) Transcript_12405:602-958(+)